MDLISVLNSIRNYLIGVFLSILLPGSILANVPDRVLIQTSNPLGLNEQVSFFLDAERKYAIDDIISAGNQNLFSPDFSKSLGFYTGNLWLRLDIENQILISDFILKVSARHLRAFYFYKPLPGGGYGHTQKGTVYPHDGREIESALPQFRIELEKGARKVFYLQLEAENELIDFFFEHLAASTLLLSN